MQVRIKVPDKEAGIKIMCGMFLIFCFLPFLFPNPVVTTNIQPYAAVLGMCILLLKGRVVGNVPGGRSWLWVGGATFLVSLGLTLINGLSINAFRAIYNYFAIFVIPCAVLVSLAVLEGIPERLFKTMIFIWFAAASIQFFIYRGFATQWISGVRWSYEYRGVVGLASEPSFLGIASFYFLHIVQKFEENRVIYMAMVLVMGTLYAQSATGMMFLVGYFVVYLFDVINSKKGVWLWGASAVAGGVFVYLLNTRLSNTRLSQMITLFLNGGVEEILSDASASVRFHAIGKALSTAFGNMLIPGGFDSRIGSGYGGLLIELGFFAIPVMYMISSNMGKTFEKTRSRVAYTIVISLLLLNNTQMGNPLLLLVIGVNIFAQAAPKESHISMESSYGPVF